ncbi:DoxX family membrane protein [Flavobacteriaceae bacterium 3-367]|uniref:DoxX family membrane protein n=1 Tax=Eudoraea algarum TaxID=3417568 RepID=UPI0032914D5E
MNSKVLLILRIILGLFLLLFGSNKFLDFMPPFELPEAAMAYFGALASAKVIPYLVGIVEIAAGLSLLLNKYASLMMLILMSVSINAVLFHATLDPGNIVPALVLLLLNIAMLYGYKNNYKDILKG